MQVKKDNLTEYKAVRIKPWLVLILVFVPCTLGNYLGHSIKNFVRAEQVENYDYVKK
jgi:hypothetical protein